MKKSILFSLFASAVLSANAAQISFFGSEDASNPFLWSSTTANQPWAGGVIAGASDTALWKGVNGSKAAPAYVAVDGAYSLNNFTVSGGGGTGSDMHLVFDSDTYGTSSLTFTYAYEPLSLNAHHADFYFDGKGSVTMNSGINLVSSDTVSSKVVFGEDISLNVATNTVFIGAGTGTATGDTIEINGSFTNSGKTFAMRNTLALKLGTKSTFDASSFTMENTSTVATETSSLTVDGTMNIGGTFKIKTTNSASVYVGSTGVINAKTMSFNTDASTSANVSQMTIDGTVNLTGALSQSSRNTIIVNGKLNANGISIGTNLESSNTPAYSIVFNGAGSKIGGTIFFPEFGGIKVNADNDWNTKVLVRGGRTGFYVDNNATFEIDNLLFVSTLSKVFLLTVTEGSKFIVDDINGSATSGDVSFIGLGQLTEVSSTLNLAEFHEKSILFRTLGTDAENDKFIASIRIAGAKNNDLHFSAYDSAAGGYWLTTIVVPEPAEWAAIFGAIALALAARRRRK